jgi:hypothetical protein
VDLGAGLAEGGRRAGHGGGGLGLLVAWLEVLV